MNERFSGGDSSIHVELELITLTKSFLCVYCTDIKTINKLIDESFAAKLIAYCPYSQFPVGAALLCEDGTIFRGTGALYGVG